MRGVQKDPEGRELANLDRLVSLAGMRVLEIGCGDGRLTWSLADRASHILAIDPDKQAIGRARRALPKHLKDHVRFVVGQAETLGLPEGSFDAAIFSWSL